MNKEIEGLTLKFWSFATMHRKPQLWSKIKYFCGSLILHNEGLLIF